MSFVENYNKELYHYGVKGMKWGHRKRVDPDNLSDKQIKKYAKKNYAKEALYENFKSPLGRAYSRYSGSHNLMAEYHYANATKKQRQEAAKKYLKNKNKPFAYEMEADKRAAKKAREDAKKAREISKKKAAANASKKSTAKPTPKKTAAGREQTKKAINKTANNTIAFAARYARNQATMNAVGAFMDGDFGSMYYNAMMANAYTGVERRAAERLGK